MQVNGLVCSSLSEFSTQLVLIHTVKGFSIVSEAEVDVFWNSLVFFYDPEDVGSLISGSSTFSKSSFIHLQVLGSRTAKA